MPHPARWVGASPAGYSDPVSPGANRSGYFSWKRTVTVKTTGRGLPLMIIGS